MVRAAGVRVAEDEVVIGAMGAASRVLLELGSDPVGHGDGAARATALRRAELAACVATTDANHARGPVDVAPSERQQLALSEAGHRGGQVYRALERPEMVVGNGAEQRLKLLDFEESVCRGSGRAAAAGRPLARGWRSPSGA